MRILERLHRFPGSFSEKVDRHFYCLLEIPLVLEESFFIKKIKIACIGYDGGTYYGKQQTLYYEFIPTEQEKMKLDPAKTALLVVDMQNQFISRDGIGCSSCKGKGYV